MIWPTSQLQPELSDWGWEDQCDIEKNKRLKVSVPAVELAGAPTGCVTLDNVTESLWELSCLAWEGVDERTCKVSPSSKRLILRPWVPGGEIYATSWTIPNGHFLLRDGPPPFLGHTHRCRVKDSRRVQLPAMCRWFLLLQLHFSISSGVYTSLWQMAQ